MAATLPLSPVPIRAGRFAQGLLSLFLGTGFTLAIFLGIAHYEKSGSSPPLSEMDDLRAVVIPLEPPPPPPITPPELEIPVAVSTGFEAAASESPVRITLNPPNMDALLARSPVAPPAVIQVGQLYSEFKPRMDLTASGSHIYQMRDVDQVPQVLYQVTPKIPSRIRSNAESLRVVLLAVVDADGAIHDIRVATSSGNPEFDAIIVDNIQEWTFAPAVRKGKKVRCLVQEKVIISWVPGSPFTS